MTKDYHRIKYISLLIGIVSLQLINSSFCYAQKDLFFLIGQSNMSGRAPILSRDTLTLKHVYLLNNEGQWVPASNPLNRFSNIRKSISMQKLGPGYSFAKALSSHLPGHTIYLVVNAHGGSTIAEWQKDGAYYNRSLKRIRIAMKTTQLKAIIWHQGESDSKNASTYMNKLKKMVTDFRKDLGMPNLPFIAGETGQWKPVHKKINKVIDTIPQNISNSAVVSSKGLSHIGSISNPHFNESGQLIFGRRYAEKVLEMVYHNQ